MDFKEELFNIYAQEEPVEEKEEDADDWSLGEDEDEDDEADDDIEGDDV